MAQLLVLFFFGLLGLSLRYWIKGEFDPGQLYLLLMVSAGRFCVLFHRALAAEKRSRILKSALIPDTLVDQNKRLDIIS